MLLLLVAASAQDAPVDPEPVSPPAGEEPVDPAPVRPPSPDEPTDPGPVRPAPTGNPDEPTPVTTGTTGIPHAELADDAYEPKLFAVGVGVFFNAGGAFIQQPANRTHASFAGELPYSGMAGFSPGAGARLEALFYDVIGVEVQLIRAWDKVQSKYTINGVDVGFDVKQPAWHLPIHLQVGIPGRVMRAYVFGGVELVFPGTADFPQPAGVPWGMSGSAETWHQWSFGLGFEPKFNLSKIDLRFPIQLRGAASAPYSSVATERATYDIDDDGVLHSMHYELRWQYYASINLGLSWYFP